MAADQADASAQFNVGWMYANGDGVPKDLVQALVWWNIAGAAGDEKAKKDLAIVEKNDRRAERESNGSGA